MKYPMNSNEISFLGMGWEKYNNENELDRWSKLIIVSNVI